MEPFESLFRRESGRLVAALTRVFGVHNLSLAEDVVQDAFCRAMEVWKFGGVPQNPAGWLLTVARNRALDVLRRERTARTFAPELTRLLESEWTLVPTLDEQLSPHALKDDLLRMMFSCCDPRLAEESQVALVLHLLCGFSVDEVAAAFVVKHAAMEKRLTRAKKVLVQSPRLFDIADPAEFSSRLPVVQRSLYLLFNEGYHGASPEFAVRTELCREAMRLTALLLEHPDGATPSMDALAALMCLNAARLPARTDAAGELLALSDQDRTKWDRNLLAEGEQLLQRSARGQELTAYHVEAAIAWVHASAPDANDTDWPKIGRALRHADGDSPLAHRGLEPGDRDRAARRAGSRPRSDRSDRTPGTAGELSVFSRNARRTGAARGTPLVGPGAFPRGAPARPESGRAALPAAARDGLRKRKRTLTLHSARSAIIGSTQARQIRADDGHRYPDRSCEHPDGQADAAKLGDSHARLDAWMGARVYGILLPRGSPSWTTLPSTMVM